MTPVARIPIALGLFILTAYASLFLASGGVLWLLVFLAVGVLGAYLTGWRLPETALPALLLRAFLFFLVVLLTPGDGPSTPPMIGGAQRTYWQGQAAAAEILVQVLLPRRQDPFRTTLMVLLMGIITLLSACNSYEEAVMRFAGPLAIVFAALALRPSPLAVWRSRVMMGIALAAGLGLGLMGIVQIQLHRVELTEWGAKLVNTTPLNELSGLPGPPQLGSRNGMRGSNQRVLRLQGELFDEHLRSLSYDTYSFGRWDPPAVARSLVTPDPDRLNPAPPRGMPLHRIEVTRLVNDNPQLYLPLAAVSLEMDPTQSVQWAQEGGGPLLAKAPAPFSYSYQVGAIGYQGLLASPRLDQPEPRATHLALSDILRRELQPLAAQITRGARTPQEKITAVTSYLLDNYTYSLRFHRGKGADPVVQFLLGQPRQGAHCEYFATAAALLLRCVDIPTRYVTGYFAHEAGEEPNTTIVRQRDAHAWCEAWLPGTGWVTVEATPPTGRPDHQDSTIEWWRKLQEKALDAWAALRAFLENADPMQLVAVGAVPLVLIAGGAYWQSYRRRTYQRPALAETWMLPPSVLAPLADRFTRVMAASGFAVPETTPWSEHIETLPEEIRPYASAFAQLYEQARFGAGAESATLQAALKRLEQALQARRSGRTEANKST